MLKLEEDPFAKLKLVNPSCANKLNSLRESQIFDKFTCLKFFLKHIGNVVSLLSVVHFRLICLSLDSGKTLKLL